MNKPQAEENANLQLSSRERCNTIFFFFFVKMKHKCDVVLAFGMVELDYQKTLANKVRLNKVYVYYLTYLLIAGLCNILSLHLTVFIHFEEVIYIYIYTGNECTLDRK